jgi:hypothetical protein
MRGFMVVSSADCAQGGIPHPVVDSSYSSAIETILRANALLSGDPKLAAPYLLSEDRSAENLSSGLASQSIRGRMWTRRIRSCRGPQRAMWSSSRTVESVETSAKAVTEHSGLVTAFVT